MSANYWASTQWYVSLRMLLLRTERRLIHLALRNDDSNNWLLDRPQLELARKEDLKYASRLECTAIGIFFSNSESPLRPSDGFRLLMLTVIHTLSLSHLGNPDVSCNLTPTPPLPQCSQQYASGSP